MVPTTSSTLVEALLQPPDCAWDDLELCALRLVYLILTQIFAVLRLSRRDASWKSAEILLLRHQLTVLQREVGARPKTNWADRALIAALREVIPRSRRLGLCA